MRIAALVFLLILIAATSSRSYAQQQSRDTNSYTWDVESSPRGVIMYLDVAFKYADSTKIITFSIAKDTGAVRPPNITILVPAPVKKENGLYFSFARVVKRPGGRTAEAVDTSTFCSVPFLDCNSIFCTARISDGYVTPNKSTKIDFFQNLEIYDLLLVLYDDDLGHHSVTLPLASFQHQFKLKP